MAKYHEIVIIGGGQAGLAMSYFLREQSQPHLILERSRIADRWHSERWDSLHFQFPNWSLRLPGFSYAGPDPEGFSHRSEVARFIEDYARWINAPVRCGVDVTSLERDTGSGRFLLTTNVGPIEAAHVVVATGPFQLPIVPDFAHSLPTTIHQMNAAQ